MKTSTYIYIFDEIDNFRGAENTIRYFEKDGKVAVLSGTAQKVMRTSGEYLQFNTNVEDVSTDSIGVTLLSGAALEKRNCHFRDELVRRRGDANLQDAIEELRRIIDRYEA